MSTPWLGVYVFGNPMQASSFSGGAEGGGCGSADLAKLGEIGDHLVGQGLGAVAGGVEH